MKQSSADAIVLVGQVAHMVGGITAAQLTVSVVRPGQAAANAKDLVDGEEDLDRLGGPRRQLASGGRQYDGIYRTLAQPLRF